MADCRQVILTVVLNIINLINECIEGCGGIYTRPEGEFYSPNYPNHYPASTRCDWIIEASYDYSIAVTFDKIDIEPSTVCSYDVIQVPTKLIFVNPFSYNGLLDI